MTNKRDELRKWKNVNNQEESKNYRRKTNEMKRARDKAKKEYLDSMLREHGISKKGRYDLMYMKTKGVGWKENSEIQNNGIEEAQKNK
jgi:hypothetical protein